MFLTLCKLFCDIYNVMVKNITNFHSSYQPQTQLTMSGSISFLSDRSLNHSSETSLFISRTSVNTSAEPTPISSNTTLAIQCRNNKIGCAVFTNDLKKVSCFLDMTFDGFNSTAEFKALYLQSIIIKLYCSSLNNQFSNKQSQIC